MSTVIVVGFYVSLILPIVFVVAANVIKINKKIFKIFK
jgi:hypothetical protein